MSVNLDGWAMPPRKRRGNVLVDLLCPKSEDRIAVVRYLSGVGPVLWHLTMPDGASEPPGAWTRLDDLEVLPELLCPTCGMVPLDATALRATAERAKGRPLKFLT